MIKIRVLAIFLFCSFVTGCSSLKNKPSAQLNTPGSLEQRLLKISAIEKWQIKGKIAFIQKNERESATLFWQQDKSKNTQKLNLTTYLGIQVFSLNSNKNYHKLTVDGETYSDNNLPYLMKSLTGYDLPVEQLQYWLFGLSTASEATYTFDKDSYLPKSLTAFHQGKKWTIQYGDYRQISGVALATKYSIKQNDLLIKISLSDWTI